jgi:hypothetical protein|tara:strand:- start:1295 stop:1480 length:186 start_codon:yes stop_codon:yes gene_type:complete
LLSEFCPEFPPKCLRLLIRFCRVAEAFFTRHHHQHLSKEEEAVLIDVAVAAKVAAEEVNYQ